MENTSDSTLQNHEVLQTAPMNHAAQQGLLQARFPSGIPNAHSFNVAYGSSGMFERPILSNQPGIPDTSFHQQEYRNDGAGITGSNPNLHPSQIGLHPRNPTFSSYVASLPAPPPYTPHHPHQMFTSPDQASFPAGRAGPLPMTAPHSTQYLLSSQPHLLRLPGSNQPQPNNFASYGVPGNIRQRFSNFHSNQPFAPDPMIKQASPMGEIMEPDSSSSSRETSSHINRKKRKACGRCGPCQRKDNCGTCMNCVNRAKGKQICVFRKCEELKKKPGSETYAAPPDHGTENVAVRQEKRKDLEQLLCGERKRSKTEESSSGSNSQLSSLHQPPHHQFSPYTSSHSQQTFDQLPIQHHNLPATNPSPQHYSIPTQRTEYPTPTQQNLSPHQTHSLVNTGSAGVTRAQPDTTDIISEALREIENHPDNTSSDVTTLSTLQPLLSQTRNEEEITSSNYQNQQPSQTNPQYQPWNHNLPQVNAPPASRALQSVHTNLPGRPPPTLPPGPGPGQFVPFHEAVPNTAVPSQALPDQLLSNLTRYNDFGSFQRNNSSSLNQESNNKLLLASLNAASSNYESNSRNQQPENHNTGQPIKTTDNAEHHSVGLIKTTITTISEEQQGEKNEASSKSASPNTSHSKNTSETTNTQSAMYHNPNLTPFSSQYSAASSVQAMNPANSYPNTMAQLHYPYQPPSSNQPMAQSQPNYHNMAPHIPNPRFSPYPNSYMASPDYQQNVSPQYHGVSGYLPRNQGPITTSQQQSGDPNYKNLIMQSGGMNISRPSLIPSTSVNVVNTVSQPNSSVLNNPTINSVDPKYMQEPMKTPESVHFQGKQTHFEPQTTSPANSLSSGQDMLQPASQVNQHLGNYGMESTNKQRSQTMISPNTMHSHNALHSPVASYNPGSPASSSDRNPTISHMPKLAPSPVAVSEADSESGAPHLMGQMNPDSLSNRISPQISPMNTAGYTGSASILGSKCIGDMAPSGPLQGEYTQANVHPNDLINSEKKTFLVQPGSRVDYQNALLTRQGIPVSNYQDRYPSSDRKERLDHGVVHQKFEFYQTLPAARSYMSTKGPECIKTAATSNTAISCTQSLQYSQQSTASNQRRNMYGVGRMSDNESSVSSGTLSRSITSPNETNLTISPGESGYDSNEILLAGDEMRSTQQENKDSEMRSFEARKTIYSEAQVEAGMEVQNREKYIESKNLHRAPVGTQAGTTNKSSVPFQSNLPSAGACISKHHSQTRSYQTFLSPKKRSLSSDDRIPHCTDYLDKKTVRLRRYSNQEYGIMQKGRRMSDPQMNIGSQSSMSSGKESQGVDIYEFHDSVVVDNKTKEIQLSANVGKSGFDQRSVNFSTSGGKRNNFVCNTDGNAPVVDHTFDTPPMTPSSVDFIHRKFSSEMVTPQFSTHSLPNKPSYILPTPPYASESPMQKLNMGSLFSPSQEKNSANDQHVPPPIQQKNYPGYLRGYKNEADSKTQYPQCSCIEGSDGRCDEAPYYTHLGAAESVQGIRKLFEKRTGYTGDAIRIEKVIYTGKEGKTSRGCPVAKWIIRRSSEEEKILVLCRVRPKHRCGTAVIVVIILLWDGLARPLADFAYSNYSTLIPKHGEPTERRCGANDERTCACQGFDEKTCGASFSFGCSWSMYYNGCKYARSNQPNKYKLTGTKNPEAEKFTGMLCERLATVMSPLYKMAAPDAFCNQVDKEDQGLECRLGENEEERSRPFSGVTACLDFCAHAHKDQHNMDSGSTVVVTLTKPELRTIGVKPSDEQLHVLPLYKLDLTNEDGNYQGVAEKIEKGGIEILNGFRREVRVRTEPRMTKKQKARARKKNSRHGVMDDLSSPPCKRKGRPPKRTRSAENLMEAREFNSFPNPNNRVGQFVSNDLHHGHEHLNQNSFQTPPHVQRHLPIPQFHPEFGSPPHPTNASMPTRWPYRRHPTFPGPVPPSPAEERKVENVSANENLPSIGSFFKEGSTPSPQAPPPPHTHPAFFSSPPTNPNFFNRESHNAMHQVDCGTTPLPSIKDVVSHPFHQTFAVVKNEPVNAQSPFSYASTIMPNDSPSVNENKINLKVYAAHNVPADHTNISPSLNSLLNSYPPGLPPNMRPTEGIQAPPAPRKQEFTYSDSEENFHDPNIGGVAIAPGHGSVLIECAKKELHATTPLLRPNRFYPSRISLVFYQHKSLNSRNHGAAEYGAKEEKRQQQRKEEREMEELLKAQANAAMAESIAPNSCFLSPQQSNAMPPIMCSQMERKPVSNSSIPFKEESRMQPGYQCISGTNQRQTPDMKSPLSTSMYSNCRPPQVNTPQSVATLNHNIAFSSSSNLSDHANPNMTPDRSQVMSDRNMGLHREMMSPQYSGHPTNAYHNHHMNATNHAGPMYTPWGSPLVNRFQSQGNQWQHGQMMQGRNIHQSPTRMPTQYHQTYAPPMDPAPNYAQTVKTSHSYHSAMPTNHSMYGYSMQMDANTQKQNYANNHPTKMVPCSSSTNQTPGSLQSRSSYRSFPHVQNPGLYPSAPVNAFPRNPNPAYSHFSQEVRHPQAPHRPLPNYNYHGAQPNRMTSYPSSSTSHGVPPTYSSFSPMMKYQGVPHAVTTEHG